MPDTVRLVIADDHQIFLDGLIMLFEKLDWITLLGYASDGDALLNLVHTTQPDVALIDLSMPGADTQSIIETVAQNHPQTRLIALTMLNDAYQASQFLALGLCGYVLKDNAFEDLLTAIKEVSGGGEFISPSLVQAIKCQKHPNPILTERERQILAQVACGNKNKLIAKQLGISERTVSFHLSNCFIKFGVSNRTQAISYAINHALIDMDSNSPT